MGVAAQTSQFEIISLTTVKFDQYTLNFFVLFYQMMMSFRCVELKFRISLGLRVLSLFFVMTGNI
jgi:hypothetical protein